MNDKAMTPAAEAPAAEIPAVACSLSHDDLAQRAARWRELASGALVQVIRTAHGQRLTFTAHPGVATELAELADLERGCCAFATWSVDRADDQVVVDISATGQEGVQAVQALFGDLPGASPA